MDTYTGNETFQILIKKSEARDIVEDWAERNMDCDLRLRKAKTRGHVVVELKKMEETVEKIIKEAMERVKNYTLSDQHWILTEVYERLRDNADECLQMEYFNVNTDDYE